MGFESLIMVIVETFGRCIMMRRFRLSISLPEL